MTEIPAANINDIDLDSITDRNAANEITRLGKLLHAGKESEADFLLLCRLLDHVGETAKAEHLLRCNVELDEPSFDLYMSLFGNPKLKEFDVATEAFLNQFGISLTLEMDDFLYRKFHSSGGNPSADCFALLGRPCQIEFKYSERNTIEAQIVLRDPERTIFKPHECLLLFYVNDTF